MTEVSALYQTLLLYLLQSSKQPSEPVRPHSFHFTNEKTEALRS